MVLFASAALRAKLRAVPCGFFFEVADGDQKVVLAVKMPSHRTRYLYLGAPAYLSVRRVEAGGVPLLWAAFCVEDDPHESFYLQRVVNEEQRELLLRLLRQDIVEIHAFNEIDRCTASFHARIGTGGLVLDAVAEPVAARDETPGDAVSQCIAEMGEELSPGWVRPEAARVARLPKKDHPALGRLGRRARSAPGSRAPLPGLRAAYPRPGNGVRAGPHPGADPVVRRGGAVPFGAHLRTGSHRARADRHHLRRTARADVLRDQGGAGAAARSAA